MGDGLTNPAIPGSDKSMKLLYLVRHAKAIPQAQGVNDFKRALSERGQDDAKAMGMRLKQKKILPELLLSSPAERALETAHIFARELNYPAQKIQLRDEVYDEEKAVLLEILKSASDSHDSLMLFGHEPTLSQIAGLLVRETEFELRTSGVLGIALDITSWEELAEDAGTLVFFDFPAQATPKVYKRARKAIAAEITACLENVLEDIDSGSAKPLGELLERTGKKLAKQLVKVLHASKVEDIAAGRRREKLRVDTREEFERSLAAETSLEAFQPPIEPVTQAPETEETSKAASEADSHESTSVE